MCCLEQQLSDNEDALAIGSFAAAYRLVVPFNITRNSTQIISNDN
jgi:hypothetical protein